LPDGNNRYCCIFTARISPGNGKFWRVELKNSKFMGRRISAKNKYYQEYDLNLAYEAMR